MISADKTGRFFTGSVAAAALPFFLLCLQACTPPTLEHAFSGDSMGTSYHVKVIASLEGEQQEAARGAIQAALDAVESKMSTYRPDSELSRFNQHSSTEPFQVSPETLEVFRIAQEVSRQSGGAFDVTVGPLVNAYGFGPEKREAPPSDEEVAKLRQRVGYRQLTLDANAGTLSKARPDIYCDLSAVAKGYGVDAAAKALEALHLDRYMVEVGGEVRVRGLNAEGKPWQIAVEKPVTDGREIERVVPLINLSMATSGDYRNYYEENGRRISHTMDARTGKPIEHALASVTVLHPECAWADAYATAIDVLGPEEGYYLAVGQELAVLMILRRPDGSFVEKASPAFSQYVAKSH